jgi:hypothetical protein
MVKNSYRLVAALASVFLLLMMTGPAALAESVESPMNGKTLEPPDAPQEYSFLVTGHVYGSHSPSTYPAASFLANVESFNAMGARFFVTLGDIVQHCNEVDIGIFERTVADALDMPLFNACGNHDVSKRELYKSHFGETYLAFRYCSELYLVLDTELGKGQIEGEQLDFVLDCLDEARDSEDVKNIFVLSHRLLWAIGNEPINSILPYVNGPTFHPKTATSFTDLILPELFTLSESRSVYLISGDVGCEWSLPLFYQKDANHDVTYVACGLGESERDAVVKVNVTEEGEVTFTPVSLSGEELQKMDYYGVDYWTEHGPDRRGAVADTEEDVLTGDFVSGVVLGGFLGLALVGGFLLLRRFAR